MCGRFTLHLSPELIAEIFRVPFLADFVPRFNVAPSQSQPVVRQTTEGRQIVQMKWGLIPHWAQDSRMGYSMINARAESLDVKPAFRGSFHSQRCLVVADGFYEWRHEGKTKEPFYITLKNGGVMAFAGLWDHWQNQDGEIVESFTIITCDSNELVSKLHNRMPVVIYQKNYSTWLNPATPLENVKKLLLPYPAERMTLWKVSSLVNSPKIDSEECIRKA
jgi:putative SOS response-associated peptidase YedK